MLVRQRDARGRVSPPLPRSRLFLPAGQAIDGWNERCAHGLSDGVVRGLVGAGAERSVGFDFCPARRDFTVPAFGGKRRRIHRTADDHAEEGTSSGGLTRRNIHHSVRS
jgi:hypothetical protein